VGLLFFYMAEQEMDGKAIIFGLASAPGHDWLREAVSIHWTGLLDWTTGLTQNGVKCLFQPFSG